MPAPLAHLSRPCTPGSSAGGFAWLTARTPDVIARVDAVARPTLLLAIAAVGLAERGLGCPHLRQDQSTTCVEILDPGSQDEKCISPSLPL